MNKKNLVESLMDEHRVTGTARNLGGKVEESIGRATGDTKSQVQGAMDRAQGAAENLYGQTKDAASDAAEGLRKKARSFEDMLRSTIEDKPYTAVAIALGLGWLLGRTHRPL
ncbi:MAG: CsbD family protein [Xanthobacteraceae bacterium]